MEKALDRQKNKTLIIGQSASCPRRLAIRGCWGLMARFRPAAYGILCLALVGNITASAEAEPPVRLLSVNDPFAVVIAANVSTFEDLAGVPIEVELVGHETLRRRMLLNAFSQHSAFDIVSIDMSWSDEIAASDIALSLDDLLSQNEIDTSGFLQSALRGAQVGGVTIGLPVQPHAELLFYRRDLLAQNGLSVPQTTDDLLAVAKALHNIPDGPAGICWNGERGPFLGQMMLHLLAAFGGRPLDDDGNPTLDTEPMRKAIGFARALLDVSPQGILDMRLDQRIDALADDRCAMSYAWTGRWVNLERSAGALAKNIGVAPAPHAPGVEPVSPIGVWLLGIPGNIDPSRLQMAFDTLIALTSVGANRAYLRYGVGTLLHTALMDDAEVAAINPAVEVMGTLERANQLQAWMRPNIPQFQSLTELLGQEVSEVLRDRQTPDDAAIRLQAAFLKILREDGR